MEENGKKNTSEDLKEKASKIINDVKDDTKSFSEEEIKNGKGFRSEDLKKESIFDF